MIPHVAGMMSLFDLFTVLKTFATNVCYQCCVFRGQWLGGSLTKGKNIESVLFIQGSVHLLGHKDSIPVPMHYDDVTWVSVKLGYKNRKTGRLIQGSVQLSGHRIQSLSVKLG